METNKIPARADVPEKDKWAIQDLLRPTMTGVPR